MASYCGKDCEACREREKMGCGGCRAWMEAKTWPGACGIAQCCRSKGHNSCETCTAASYCAKLQGRGQEPWYSMRRLEADSSARRQLQERGRDVYKRQGSFSSAARRAPGSRRWPPCGPGIPSWQRPSACAPTAFTRPCGKGPVSYTHLDVYKRQDCAWLKANIH